MAVEKNPERLKVLEKIEELEKKRLWSKDVEEDPPTIPLQPDMVDYGYRKFSSKVKSFFANFVAYNFIESLLRKKKLIIKDVIGLENYTSIKDRGIVLTCNHFNAFDNFAIHKIFMPHAKSGVIWKVIREGNYTNFPGLYGFFFKYCNTLPLSSNFSTMRNFMDGVKYLLKKKRTILIYPEQGMWWNYKKPRPMENGAFRFAASNGVPIVPVFICMTDSDKIDSDGFPVQEYTVNVLKPIFPDGTLTLKENVKMMNEVNYQEWKECYEKFYGIPLKYLEQE